MPINPSLCNLIFLKTRYTNPKTIQAQTYIQTCTNFLPSMNNAHRSENPNYPNFETKVPRKQGSIQGYF